MKNHSIKIKDLLLGLVFSLALAATACSIDEVSQVNDTNAVTFKATTATRAAAVTTNSIQEFTVWAWNDSNEFMDHVTATKQSNGTFTTSPYYFWPTGTVDFYALHPASVGYGVSDTTSDELAYIGGEISIDEDDMGGTHYTYTGNVATADIQEDNIVIEAYIPGTAEDQIDLCYAITKDRSSGAVPMNFRHALSQVVFKVKDINADFVVDIAEVSICSVNRYGKYTLKGVASTTDDITLADTTSHGVWSDWAHKTRFEASCTPQTLDTDGTVVDITGDPLLLIPQTVEGWDPLTDTSDEELGSYIRVLCHVTEHGSTLWPNDSEENVLYPDTNNPTTGYAYIAMPVDVDWEEGYRYTYTIMFGNGLGYYPPDDPNTELEGTPVLNIITFNVTVDEFQDAGGVDVTTEPEEDDIIPLLVDEEFIKYLLEDYDKDGDGHISHAEAAAVTVIVCNTATDFTGLDNFPNLKRFTSYSAETLDLSSNTELIYISLSNVNNGGVAAPIKTLDLSNNLKLESLSMYAFYGCANLESIILPESLTTIGTYAFYKCESLKSIELPDGVTSIGINTFAYCSSLESVTLPSALTEIGDYAFSYCDSLASILLPDTVVKIGSYAFHLSSSLAEINFPDVLETIGSSAFRGTALPSVVLPASVTSLGGSSFQSCSKLESIDLSKLSLTSLPTSICQACSSLTSVSLPSTITKFESYVFYNCSSLAEIELPEGLTEIARYAFYTCSSLNDLVIPAKVETLGASVFYKCTSMRTMYCLPTTPPEIGSDTFYGLSINTNTCDLYVPAVSVDAYTEAWSGYFTTISAIEN